MNVGDQRRPADHLMGTYYSANLFQLIGQRPLLGRDFTVDADRTAPIRW